MSVEIISKITCDKCHKAIKKLNASVSIDNLDFHFDCWEKIKDKYKKNPKEWNFRSISEIR